MCYPDFDSPTIFGRLLDRHRGGHFSIGPLPSPDLLTKQIHLPDSNVLMTRFSVSGGVGQVTDLLLVHGNGVGPMLTTKLEVVRGSFEFIVKCQPAFEYGRVSTHIFNEENRVRFASSVNTMTLYAFGEKLNLHDTSISMHDFMIDNSLIEQFRYQARLTMDEGQVILGLFTRWSHIYKGFRIGILDQ